MTTVSSTAAKARDTKWFPPEFRTAGVVPRWSVCWTLTRDVLSNHSFFTAVYSNQIAKMIGWKGDYGALLIKALFHDLDETTTGDLVAPIKSEIIDQPRAQAYIRKQMLLRMATVVDQNDQIDNQYYGQRQLGDMYRIIKAADRLDALLFLIIERRMGNGVIGPLIPQVQDGLKQSWFLLPADGRVLSELWEEHVLPALDEHAVSGGFGV